MISIDIVTLHCVLYQDNLRSNEVGYTSMVLFNLKVMQDIPQYSIQNVPNHLNNFVSLLTT